MAHRPAHGELAELTVGEGSVHVAAASGYQTASDAYVAARPAYHPHAFDLLIERLGATAWIDLGAGTGIATGALVARGVDVVAVEPVAAMRAELTASLRGVRAVEGTANGMPVGDGEAAVVLAAQSFHWFEHGPALDEIARVLQADGALVTLWNVRDESVPWVADYTTISNRHAGDTPRWHTMIWRRAIERDRRFELDHEQAWPNPHPSSPELAVARLLSTSYIAALDDETRAGLADELRAVVDPLGESFDYPYETQVQVWRRTAQDHAPG